MKKMQVNTVLLCASILAVLLSVLYITVLLRRHLHKAQTQGYKEVELVGFTGEKNKHGSDQNKQILGINIFIEQKIPLFSEKELIGPGNNSTYGRAHITMLRCLGSSPWSPPIGRKLHDGEAGQEVYLFLLCALSLPHPWISSAFLLSFQFISIQN